VMYLNFMEVAPRAEQLPFVVGCTEKWLERFPGAISFGLNGILQKTQLCFITIFRASPVAFGANDLRGRVDRILGQFVGLGAAQAHEMETMLYQTNQ